jgi:syntaxin-binding protein 1
MPLANTQQWKILIVDEDSKKLIDNVVKEDDILNLNITSTLPCP